MSNRLLKTKSIPKELFLMLNRAYQDLNIRTISSEDIENMCQFCLCWASKRTKKCSICERMFCEEHADRHFCSKNFGSWS